MPSPEVPTRIVKQLAQIVRGGMAIGMPKPEAMALAMRIAHDCLPPLGSRIIADMLSHNGISTPRNTRGRLNMPYNTVSREFKAMNMLGVLVESKSYHGVSGSFASAVELLFPYVEAT